MRIFFKYLQSNTADLRIEAALRTPQLRSPTKIIAKQTIDGGLPLF